MIISNRGFAGLHSRPILLVHIQFENEYVLIFAHIMAGLISSSSRFQRDINVGTTSLGDGVSEFPSDRHGIVFTA